MSRAMNPFPVTAVPKLQVKSQMLTIEFGGANIGNLTKECDHMVRQRNSPKVAVEKVGVPSMKFLLPEMMVASFPSPYIVTYQWCLSITTFSVYLPAFTYITNLNLLFFGILSTASFTVLTSPLPSLATVTFGRGGFAAASILRSSSATQAGKSSSAASRRRWPPNGILNSPSNERNFDTMARLLLANSAASIDRFRTSPAKAAPASSSASRHVSWSVTTELSHVRMSPTVSDENRPPPSETAAAAASLRKSTASSRTAPQTLAAAFTSGSDEFAAYAPGSVDALRSASAATVSENLKIFAGSDELAPERLAAHASGY
ncbi:KxDL motif-containing protein 1 [Striga asiatica]|uniref:KxDL motif-containing protein 1 n=1 Tax=Striga asiatica TaxID=4170 RepID=A0A5A7RAK3_STRAF|nr:KxDL motif-containing protein 1 [Striga asiatica]